MQRGPTLPVGGEKKGRKCSDATRENCNRRDCRRQSGRPAPARDAPEKTKIKRIEEGERLLSPFFFF
ncbi:MAG: hypothetical protein C6W56_05790 [Caldibacillus debilis]|nr:MAG: hypothetical protein C6W56_05790 [Caldibacillus debilis]